MPEDSPFAPVLVGFARALRAAGITVGTGDVLTYFSAMSPLDPSDLADLYVTSAAYRLSAGQLNINNVSALGTGTLTISA